MFLFWSIGTGIICGAELYKVAIVLAVCVTFAIVVLKLIPGRKTGKIIKVKSVNVTSAGTNAAFDVRVSDADGIVKAIKEIKGVDTVSLVAHDGEFRG